jgi:uncharacterized protein involved in exopolysaccharide biosynthesis
VRLGLYWLVIVVMGAAAGLAITMVQTKLYAADATVQYKVSQQDASDNLRVDRAMTTQTLLITGRSVIGPVAQANGVDPDDLAKHTSATILQGADSGSGDTGSSIIQIQVLNADPSTGVKLANALAQQYLLVAATNSPAVYLQQQIDATKTQLTSSSDGDAATLQSRLTSLQGQMDVEMLAGSRASIAAPAYADPDPAYPNQILAAATGTFCGIVAACLFAIWMSRRWTRG